MTTLTHPDTAAFRSPTQTDKTRAAIYSFLRDHPESLIGVAELAKAIGAEYSSVYHSVWSMVNKNLVAHRLMPRFKKDKSGKQVQTGTKHGFAYTPPWSSKLLPKKPQNEAQFQP